MINIFSSFFDIQIIFIYRKANRNVLRSQLQLHLDFEFHRSKSPQKLSNKIIINLSIAIYEYWNSISLWEYNILPWAQNPHVFAHLILFSPFVQFPLCFSFLHFFVDFMSLQFPVISADVKNALRYYVYINLYICIINKLIQKTWVILYWRQCQPTWYFSDENWDLPLSLALVAWHLYM